MESLICNCLPKKQKRRVCAFGGVVCRVLFRFFFINIQKCHCTVSLKNDSSGDTDTE